MAYACEFLYAFESEAEVEVLAPPARPPCGAEPLTPL